MRKFMRPVVALLMVLGLVASGSGAALAIQATPEAVGEGSITIIGGAESPVTLTVADLQAMPSEFLEVTYTSGGEPQDRTFTGTSFLGVIESIGLDVEEDARNPLLYHAFLVTAADGYQVIFSGGELDPNFGDEPVYLAWEQDGALLDEEDGPIRVVVPGDTRGGRYVSGVVSIEIISFDDLEHDH